MPRPVNSSGARSVLLNQLTRLATNTDNLPGSKAVEAEVVAEVVAGKTPGVGSPLLDSHRSQNRYPNSC